MTMTPNSKKYNTNMPMTNSALKVTEMKVIQAFFGRT